MLDNTLLPVHCLPQRMTVLACSRVHDRTISHVRYLPEEGLVVTLAFDNTMRIFNALQATVRCVVVNDTGGPFTGMEHDPTRSQVSMRPFTCCEGGKMSYRGRVLGRGRGGLGEGGECTGAGDASHAVRMEMGR